MAALTQDRKSLTRWIGRSLSLPVAANAIPFQMGLVSESATGFAKPSSMTANERVMGWSDAKVDNTGGADGAVRVPVRTGVILLDNDAVNPVVQADVGRFCFVKDDHTVQAAIGVGAGVAVIAGKVEDLDARGVWVFVEPDVGLVGGLDAAPIVDNQTTPGLPVVFEFAIPDAATADYDIIVKRKIEVIDVIVRKSGAGAANTITVKKAAAAISNAIAADTDKAVTRAGTLDPANFTLNAGDTLRVTATKAAGSMLASVTVIAIPR